MKMVKAILLGTSAAMVSTFASAADLPRKAAPAEYVQVCQGQGAGFFVVPGTTTCLKIGGFVRAEAFFSSSSGAATSAATVYGQNNYAFGSRFFADFDARTQSAYGTVRSYARIFASRGASDYPHSSYTQGFASNPAGATTTGGLQGAGAFNTLEAFIQFAGLTAGFTHSQFEFFGSGSPDGHGVGNYSFQNTYGSHDTRANQFAYTAQFGGGLSATVSLEDAAYRRATPAAAFAIPTGAATVADAAIGYGALKTPDVVAALAYSAGPIKAQIMGAYHEVRTIEGYSSAGYALGAGIAYKIMPTTEVALQASYSNGAVSYTGARGLSTAYLGNGGTTVNYSVADAYYNNVTGGISKTTAWSVIGGVNHFWSPAFRTSLQAGYLNIDQPTVIASATSKAYDAKGFQVAFTNVWMPIAQLQIGLEIFYENNKFGQNGTTNPVLGVAGNAAEKNSTLGASIRVQRAF